jgi:hypothetical protein
VFLVYIPFITKGKVLLADATPLFQKKQKIDVSQTDL